MSVSASCSRTIWPLAVSSTLMSLKPCCSKRKEDSSLKARPDCAPHWHLHSAQLCRHQGQKPTKKFIFVKGPKHKKLSGKQLIPPPFLRGLSTSRLPGSWGTRLLILGPTYTFGLCSSEPQGKHSPHSKVPSPQLLLIVASP